MRTISAISSQLDIALTCGLPHPFAFVRKGGQGALHQGATHFHIELGGQPIAAKFCGALLRLTDEDVRPYIVRNGVKNLARAGRSRLHFGWGSFAIKFPASRAWSNLSPRALREKGAVRLDARDSSSCRTPTVSLRILERQGGDVNCE